MQNDLVKLKKSVFPEHAHNHRHKGRHSYDNKFKTGPLEQHTSGGGAQSNSAMRHRHDTTYTFENGVTVDFAHMSEEKTFITHFANQRGDCDISKEDCEILTSNDGNLYPKHMRVKFIFKCS